MKKTMFFSIVWIMTLCLIISTKQTNAQNNDEQAIKKTLQQETSSYFQKDYDGWANNWAHDSACYVVSAGPSAQFQLIGWNAISNEYEKSIRNLSDMDDTSIAPFLNKKDFRFYINGNVATVSFNQGDILPKFETSTLIKQNGVWKILNFTLIDNGSYSIQNIMKIMESFMGKNWMAK